ncbi:DNA mismatch repair protein msh6, partial [Dissophora globulifera]
MDRPTKSPSKAKGAGTQPGMTQKTLFSFFKPPAPSPSASTASAAAAAAASGEPSLSQTPVAFAGPPRTPVKSDSKGNASGNGPLESPPSFSKDNALLKGSKRKTVDFEDDDDNNNNNNNNNNASSLPKEDARSVKKFAAAVEKLSLDSPVRKMRREELEEAHKGDGEDEDELSLNARRSSRGIRRIKYQISDDDEDEDDGGKGASAPTKPRRKAKVTYDDDDDSEYEAPAAVPEDDFNMDIDEADLAELDEDDDDAPASPTRHKSSKSLPVPALTPLAQPKPALASLFNRPAASPSKPPATRPGFVMKDDKKKERAAKFAEENTKRYSWLLNIKDADGNPVGSPDYDPRTLYIPSSAWGNFSDFERQFWEIKGQHFDSIVFFKKGKFYELYERDADIGSQQFDLKMTDRVNMRMVGVPESSFDYWAAQFIAKGFKVARVDQMETALGKAMRERDGAVKKSAVQKVIRRELHSILTAGTLTDSGLLTNEMATYCMAIKELNRPGAEHLPTQFGVVFVDTATAEFNLATFYDDMDRTKFETLVTQIKPREIVFEKGGLSVRSSRVLKSSLGSNTIWNPLQPETQFLGALDAADELRIGGYFGEDASGSSATDCWPSELQKMKDNAAVMSAMGGLVWYLKS